MKGKRVYVHNECNNTYPGLLIEEIVEVSLPELNFPGEVTLAVSESSGSLQQFKLEN